MRTILAIAITLAAVTFAYASHGPGERNWCSISQGNDSSACK